MAQEPWWIQRVTALLAPASLEGLTLGALWHLSEQLQFVRESADRALLEVDFDVFPQSRALWAAFEQREVEALTALAAAGARLAAELHGGALGPQRFRESWQSLGYVAHAQGAGTAADDHLDGLLELARLTTGEPRPDFGNLNVSSRAYRVADFLAVTEPGPSDVVFDLGSGSGKLALIVAASTQAQVRGVELGGSYVEAARVSAERLGLRNVTFLHGDVREAPLGEGTIFYLYYPFHGEVARAVAEALGAIARAKAITLYASGPHNDYGEHFLRQVDAGALVLSERRGEFSDTLVLRSARS